MERGRHWEGGARLIRETEALRDPDILLLGEMDLGMARSGNAHTTRALATALGMNYAYGVEFLELTGGELEERKLYPGENEWGYHGNAILSRYPLRNVRMLRFPGIEKWYEGKGANESEKVQKRLGGRMALFATVRLDGRRRHHRLDAPRELGEGQRQADVARRDFSSTRCARTRRARR